MAGQCDFLWDVHLQPFDLAQNGKHSRFNCGVWAAGFSAMTENSSGAGFRQEM
jgi:hypothetical protein